MSIHKHIIFSDRDDLDRLETDLVDLDDECRGLGGRGRGMAYGPGNGRGRGAGGRGQGRGPGGGRGRGAGGHGQGRGPGGGQGRGAGGTGRGMGPGDGQGRGAGGTGRGMGPGDGRGRGARGRGRGRGYGAAEARGAGYGAGQGRQVAGPSFGIRRPVRYLARQLDLSQEQTNKVVAVLDDLKTEYAQAGVDEQRAQKLFAEALGAPDFDAVKAEAAAARRVQSAKDVQAATVAALAALHTILDAGQRSELTALVRSGTLTF